jgi:hypothetical protein
LFHFIFQFVFYLPLPKFVPIFLPIFAFDFFYRNRLVSSTTGLGDDALELIDLSLGTAEGTELLGSSS